jgi:hypothetical protein
MDAAGAADKRACQCICRLPAYGVASLIDDARKKARRLSTMTSSDQPCVEVRREDRLLIISMRREAKRNAINREMADRLDSALNQLDDDDSLWAGVLAGSDSIFCAGS